MEKTEQGTSRYFETGATRDTAEGKLDIHRFLSPAVLRRYCQYLDTHRLQSDGRLRDPDNWKKGMPKDVYMASMTRHFWELWEQQEAGGVDEVSEDTLCALMFNVAGFLFESLRQPVVQPVADHGPIFHEPHQPAVAMV